MLQYGNRILANIADRCKTKSYCAAFDTECCRTRIDVRRQYPDFHLMTKPDIDGNFIRLIHNAREDARHEFYGVMCFEICCLPCKESVRCTVRFIKPIIRKMCQQIKDMVREGGVDAVIRTTSKKRFLLSHEELMLFLAHSTPQEIRLTERKSREHLYDLHDLLLIEYDPECLL